MADLYADQNIDRRVVQLLEGSDHRVTTPRAMSLRRATDAEHLAVAARNGWILVTHDRDFLFLQAVWVAWTAGGCIAIQHAGIIRLPNTHFRAVFQRIDGFLERHTHLANELWEYDPRPGVGWYRPPSR